MKPWIVAALALSSAPGAAQRIAETVAEAVYPARLSSQGLEGPGAEVLLEEGRAAEFFLIGESHGNVQTCRLTGWLLEHLGDAGYDALAIETGPCTTETLVAVAESGGVDGVVDFIEENPFTVAFLFWREEVELFVDAIDRGWSVWGLDQEFVGSPRLLLRLLAENASSDAARDLAAEWLARAEAGFAHFAATGDRSRGFMALVQPDDFAALAAAFADEDPSLVRILDELRATTAIYGHYHAGRYYLNNRDRIDLMKRHLADRLRARGDEARVVLKFGSVHMGRGYSPMAQLDLGNFAAEVSVARGGRSFHLNVFARRAVAVDGSVTDFEATTPWLAPFYEALEGDAAVFDLRPLRPLLSAPSAQALNPELHDLVFRFDALLLVAEFDATTPLIPMPQAR